MLEVKTVGAIFVLLCAINMLNYIDRGIIPGSPLQFEGFISSVLHANSNADNATSATTTPHTGVSAWLGLLVSAFIAGYSVFSIAFGYWAIYYRPFVLIAAGLVVWVVAMFLCGLADAVQSLNLLLIGRILSGVGESSFQAIAPSFIDDHAPPAKRTLWLGVFYCGITVGTASGYFYSAMFATSVLRWPWAFYSEGLLMVPLVLMCVFCIPKRFNLPGGHMMRDEPKPRKSIIVEENVTRPTSFESDSSNPAATTAQDGLIHSTLSFIEPRLTSSTPAVAGPSSDRDTKSLLVTPRVSLHVEIWEILKSPLFMLVAMGSAAYVFSISGLGAFGPSLLIGMGLFEEKSAAMVFGAIIVVAGTIGTLLGGLCLDRNCKTQPDNDEFRVYMATRQLCVMLTLGTTFLVVSWLLLDYGLVLTVSALSLALTFLFGCVPASVVAIILSVDKRRRGLALGINTLLSHVFGDVPSPIVLGLIKDSAAPHCNIVADNKLNPLCAQDRQGLKLTLLFPYLWLVWAIVLSAVAVQVARRNYDRRLKSEAAQTLSPGGHGSIHTC
ncbi:hypothetical protein DYB37_003291 [Aphanomyces astaci]|uniref:Major facilitator superfamily (MFS) profile domain-containing protein n=3 Tax=Aphanomyces astaci TaxID=112090 RepID=A0A3R6X1D6_APHAT|nr:hypothetical protein DYB35_004642 [Aphanomyces astaci]RHZ23222.1 hypothetical protein DYB37_003291 [Aphanomyces astaci]